MRKTKLYRGFKKEELKEIHKTGLIPSGKRFTSSYFGARQHGEVYSVDKNKNFTEDEQNSIFKTCKLKERYYFNKKPIKRFNKVIRL